MSTTSGRGLRGEVAGDTDDIVGTARARVTVPRYSTLQMIVATDGQAPGAIARLALGLVMFPHAAQKVFGWFGGPGLESTYNAFTTGMGLPGWVAAAVIMTEMLASLMLIAGAFTRIAAGGIIGVMVGAIVLVHAPHGFFMNWYGQQAGEGFEYHLLALGLAMVALILGGGAVSVDRMLMNRRPAAAARREFAYPVTRD
jgi:putative oxidoreductase